MLETTVLLLKKLYWRWENLYYLIHLFTCRYLFSGEYRVGIKFNDQHIPDSPHKVYISPAMGDAHKLEVAQFPESGVQPDKPCTFLVRKNGAKGELDAKVKRLHSCW